MSYNTFMIHAFIKNIEFLPLVFTKFVTSILQVSYLCSWLFVDSVCFTLLISIQVFIYFPIMDVGLDEIIKKKFKKGMPGRKNRRYCFSL